jgi:hypothetical protein
MISRVVVPVGGTVALRQSKKRTRRQLEEDVETVSDLEEQNHKRDSPKRRRQTKPEVIDLTMSSPVAPNPAEQRAIKFDNPELERSPSSGFDYGSADEHEVS